MKTLKKVFVFICVFPGILMLSRFYAQAQDVDLYEDEVVEKQEEKFTYSVAAALHYNDVVYDQNSPIKTGKLDFHELHLKAGYKLNKQLKIKSAFEIEHAFNSYYDGGDMYFKQVYIDYHKTAKIGVKAGLVTLPISGSKSKIYTGVEIASNDKYLTYAWRELGFLMYGNLTSKLSYQAGITTGLEASEISSKYGIYSARNNDLFSSVNTLASAVQLKYKMDQNLTLGTSVLISGLQNKKEYGDKLKGASYTLLEGFAKYKLSAFTTRLVGVYSTIKEADKINQSLHKHIGSSQYGSLAEVTYDFLYDTKKRNLIVYSRAEVYDTQFSTTGFEADPKYKRNEFTLGVLYKPFKQIEFKADYQWLQSGGKKNIGQLNIALGYMF